MLSKHPHQQNFKNKLFYLFTEVANIFCFWPRSNFTKLIHSPIYLSQDSSNWHKCIILSMKHSWRFKYYFLQSYISLIQTNCKLGSIPEDVHCNLKYNWISSIIYSLLFLHGAKYIKLYFIRYYVYLALRNSICIYSW